MFASFLSPRRSSSKHRARVVEPVPVQPCPRIDFWISGSRDDLEKRILPHLTRSLREEQYFVTIMEQKPWVVEFLRSEHAKSEGEESDEDVNPDPQDFSRCMATFEKSPQPMVDDLIMVSRSWFRILLRYRFRSRYNSQTPQAITTLNLQELSDSVIHSRLDEKSVMRRQNLFKEYKDIYKETKSRPEWTYFCSRIKSFFRIVKFETSSTKLEAMFEDFQRNLPQILLHRMEAMKLEMKRMTTSLQDELEVHRLDESLKSCRELMEKLLPEDPKGKGTWKPRGQEYGRRWRELYAKEWQRCRLERPRGHPLLPLIRENKYELVGQSLYNTLSERIHNHQQYRDQEIDKDVLKVIISILPPDWEETRRWDLPAEKKRWGLA